ncbi:MAG: molybdopterin molybdenumtransferase MoeA, partial [Lysobacter sp.]|nr:molybdopterin molybdenumtransferase MoeA [Lysobacter sp.]
MNTAAFPTGLSLDEALACIAAVAAQRRLPAEQVAIARADGRVLAQDVVAPIDLPPFRNSAMDGFAIRHAGLVPGTPLRLVGEQFAGIAQGLQVAAGECVRITTGAPMPDGADTVLIREHAREQDGRVWCETLPATGANVRHAGEDVRAGERVLSVGDVLTPARAAVAAALGIARVDVARRPTVAVFT